MRAANGAEAGYTDTNVGVMARSTAREHGEQGESGKRVMGSSKDRSTSMHSEDNIDVKESLQKASAEREESARRGVRHANDGIRRATGEIGSASRGYTRRTKEEPPGRQRRSGGLNKKEGARTGHGGLDGAGGSRLCDGYGGPGGYDGPCGKDGLARSGRRSRAKSTRTLRTRLIAMTENLTSFPFLAHTGGCAVWWGRMS